MKRTIEITFQEDPKIYKEFIHQAQKAIGRLSLWGIDGYDKVTIWPDGKGLDFIAHYENTQNSSKYTIGAIWREDTKEYSFHS